MKVSGRASAKLPDRLVHFVDGTRGRQVSESRLPLLGGGLPVAKCYYLCI